jgi:RimJ/RimL family protein N-acetyltransferase
MRKVELATARASLRAPASVDADAIAAACQDAEIQRWVPVPVPYSLGNALDFVRASDAGWESESLCTWAIHFDGHVVGVVSLDRIADAQATIGYWLAPDARGQGVLTEAARAVTEFAFGPSPRGLGLDRIEWHANAGNVSSARIAQRLGFRFEGTRRQTLLGRHGLEDDWVAGLRSTDVGTTVAWPLATVAVRARRNGRSLGP